MNVSRRLTAALCATLVASCVLPSVLKAQQKIASAIPPAQPLVAISGSDSKVTERSVVLIRSQEELSRTWRRHLGLPESRGLFGQGMPQVNFSKCVVVAVFQGEQSNNEGVVVDTTRDGADRFLLRIDNRWYSTLRRAGTPEPAKLTPYGFFVLPRTEKEIVVEEAVHRSKTDPPTWQERARFP